MTAGHLDALAGRLDAVERDALVVEEAAEQAHRIRPSTDARDRGVRQAALERQDLLARLAPDDRLELAHHRRVRVGADDGADAEEDVLEVTGVGVECRIDGLLERTPAELDRHDLRAEHLHAHDVRVLLGDVDRTHVDLALETHVRGCRRESDAVLAGTRLRDELLLAHALREQGLAEAVVDLVRPGVVEILTFEVDARAADVARQVVGREQHRRTARVEREQTLVLAEERRVGLRLGPRACHLGHRLLEVRRHETATELTEEAFGVRVV